MAARAGDALSLTETACKTNHAIAVAVIFAMKELAAKPVWHDVRLPREVICIQT